MRTLKLTEEEFALLNQALNIAAIFLKSEKNMQYYIDETSKILKCKEEKLAQFAQDKASSFEDLAKKIIYAV